MAGLNGVRSATSTPFTMVTGFTGCWSSAHVGDGWNGSPVVVVIPASSTTVNVVFSGSGMVGTITSVSTGTGVSQLSARNRKVVVGITTDGTSMPVVSSTSST